MLTCNGHGDVLLLSLCGITYMYFLNTRIGYRNLTVFLKTHLIDDIGYLLIPDVL